jgi:hypothetical protein
MFISKRRFILKTCGTTTLLGCLKDLTSLALTYAGFDGVEVSFPTSPHSSLVYSWAMDTKRSIFVASFEQITV